MTLSYAITACSDGLGRSCLFSALWLLSDQLDAEDQVDVVSTFKNIRSSRPGALSSLVSVTWLTCVCSC